MNNPTLLKNLRVIPDFPIPGIQFQDISTLFDNPECLHIMRDEVVDYYKDKKNCFDLNDMGIMMTNR